MARPKARAKTPPAPATRKRRTAEEARTAILDAAERRLVEVGPSAIRLQEVASDVGVSHPTVLHHFGSREGLVEAVIARAQQSIFAGLAEALARAPHGEDGIASLLEGVAAALKERGRARAILWLSLTADGAMPGGLRLREVAEVIHGLRKERRAGKKRPKPFEDALFTVVLSALVLTAGAVLGPQIWAALGEGSDEKRIAATEARFRAWVARLMLEHLERE